MFVEGMLAGKTQIVRRLELRKASVAT